MKNFRLITVITVCALAISSTAFAISGHRQDFDDVTAPALPSDWTSVSLAGAQVARTSILQSDSSPNSVLMTNPNTVSDTALVSPVFSFATGAPTHRLNLTFDHKRGMENGFDGGVLEVSINGAPFVDVTDPAVGGVFNTNGYNDNALSTCCSNPIPGRAAWTGTSVGFEPVELEIPAMPSETPFQFRFRLGSDSSVAGTGWFIDNFGIDIQLETLIEVVPGASQVKAGDEVSFVIRHINPASVELPLSMFYISSPSGDVIEDVTLSSGFVQRINDFMYVVQTMTPVPPFGSAELILTLQTRNPARAGARYVIDQTLATPYVGASSALGFLSSGPSLPDAGLLNVPVFVSGADLCTMPPGPVPAEIAGSAVFAVAGACPLGQSAAVAQSAGAAAFVRMASPVPPPPAPQISPFVEEAATPGLGIPAFSTEGYSMSLIAGAVFSGPPGSTHISLFGSNKPQRSTSVLAVMNLLGDEVDLSNNFVSASVEIVTDQDNDGTPDDGDGCAFDASKVTPGACGCGVPDADANANGVADCLATQDFKANVSLLKTSVSQLKVNKFLAQKVLRARVKSLLAAVTARAGQAGITVSSPSVNLAKLGKALKKPIKKLASSTNGFADNKKAALKALKALLKGIA